MQLKFILQQIQDAYAEQLKLTTFIIDCYGEKYTHVSHDSELMDEILQHNSLEFKVKFHEKEKILQKLTRPVLIDGQEFSDYLGLKVILAPIKINGQTTLYIWTGVFIEQGYKNLILQNISKDSILYRSIENLDELSFIQVDEILQILGKFVAVTEELIGSYEYQARQEITIKTITDLLTEKSITSRIKILLHQFKNYDPNLDFVCFAKYKDDENIEIVDLIGQLDSSQLFSLLQKDDLLHETIKKREISFLETKNGLDTYESSPISLFVCPIGINDVEEGLVFGGSLNSYRFLNPLPSFCQLIKELVDLLNKKEELEGSLDRHLMRMSALLEMSNAMNMMKTKDEVLHMLVDIALELFPGDFCSVSNGELLVYKIPNSKINPSILQSRFHTQPFIKTPQLLETEWGVVLQYPLINRKRDLGVLTIHLANSSSIKESEVIITRLVNIASEVIDNLGDSNFPQQDESNHFVQEHAPLLKELTAREVDVLHHLAKGYSNREIAEKLYISTHTVKNHISNIFQKIGVSDRAQLIAMVYQLNTMNLS